MRSNIKAELFVNEFGQQEGLNVHAETDPAVEKALELLPKAKELGRQRQEDDRAAQQRPPHRAAGSRSRCGQQ